MHFEEVERGEPKPAAAPLDWLFHLKLQPGVRFVQATSSNGACPSAVSEIGCWRFSDPHGRQRSRSPSGLVGPLH